MFSRFHEVGALMPLRAKFSMKYRYSSFWEDAEDRVNAIRDQVEEAIVAVEPGLKRKFPKLTKYIMKSLLPVVKNVLASDTTDQPLEQMVEHIVGEIKRDIGQLKLNPYLRIDDTKPVWQAWREEVEDGRKAQTGLFAVDQKGRDAAKKREEAVKKFLTRELGLRRVFYLASPRWVLHALIVGVQGALQLALGIVGGMLIPSWPMLTSTLREEGANDLRFAIEAFLKGDCPHVKRWFKDVKLPSVCQSMFGNWLESFRSGKQDQKAGDEEEEGGGLFGPVGLMGQQFTAKLLLSAAQGVKAHLQKKLTQSLMDNALMEGILRKLHESMVRDPGYQRNKLKIRNQIRNVYHYYQVSLSSLQRAR